MRVRDAHAFRKYIRSFPETRSFCVVARPVTSVFHMTSRSLLPRIFKVILHVQHATLICYFLTRGYTRRLRTLVFHRRDSVNANRCAIDAAYELIERHGSVRLIRKLILTSTFTEIPIAI